jgi:hypothetical protein
MVDHVMLNVRQQMNQMTQKIDSLGQEECYADNKNKLNRLVLGHMLVDQMKFVWLEKTEYQMMKDAEIGFGFDVYCIFQDIVQPFYIYYILS